MTNEEKAIIILSTSEKLKELYEATINFSKTINKDEGVLKANEARWKCATISYDITKKLRSIIDALDDEMDAYYRISDI